MSLKAKDMNLLRSTMRAMDKLQTAWEQNDEAGIDKYLGKLMARADEFEKSSGKSPLDTVNDLMSNSAADTPPSLESANAEIMRNMANAARSIMLIIGPDDFRIFQIIYQQKEEIRQQRYMECSPSNMLNVRERELKVKLKQLLCDNHDAVVDLWKHRLQPPTQ